MIPNALANIETCEEEADVITANIGNKEPAIAMPKTENGNGKHQV